MSKKFFKKIKLNALGQNSKLCKALFVAAAISLSSVNLVAQEQTYTANYKDANVLEVIKAVQEATGKLMVVDPRVKGQITVLSSEPLTLDEYYNLFLSTLNTLGFTAIENGNIVSIVPNKEARSSPLPFLAKESQGSSKYVQEIFKLDNVSAAQVLPSIRPLISQGGQSHMAAFPASNVIIMVDTVANVERIRSLLNQIDQAAIPETEMIPLEHAEAEEMVRMLEQIERNADPANKTAGTKLQVIADKRTNSILITGEPRQRTRVKNLIRRVDQPQKQSGNARVIYLEYADAEQVAKVLTSVVQNMAKLNPDEKAANQMAAIEAEKDTNSLIITADLETISSLLSVVERLDIQRAQVLVEAIIVEVNDNFGKSLGVQWLYRNDEGGFVSNFKEGNNATAVGAIAQGALEEDSEEALTTLAGALAGVAGQTIGLGKLTDSYDILAMIDLLQGTTGTNILSTPNLLTTDNHTAKITVGEAVPFVTGSFTSTGDSSNPQNPFQTIDRENVGTILEVTPHVNEGDKVALDIIQEVSSISQKVGAAGIITNERKIETRVTVKDGETIVLGGLIKDNVLQRETRVPVLGSIPVLGHLFRSRSNTTEKTNLLIFIRPTIIRDDATMRGATGEKYKYIREQQLKQRGISSLLLNSDDLPLLPDWDEQTEALDERQRNKKASVESAPAKGEKQ
ncbi:MAG: type II secretion system secretin GspD [Cellvibrionaceae bacterium]